MKDSDWVHNDDPLECGVRLPKYSINLWRKPALISDWQSGSTLRLLAKKYQVSHETARKWTEHLTRSEGASRKIVCKNRGGDVTVHGECRRCHAVAGESCRTEKPTKPKPEGK